MDYSKWDKLEREIQEEEEAQEFMEREARKQKYLREQELKRKQYVEKYGKEPPKSSCCGSADPNKILNNQKYSKQSTFLVDFMLNFALSRKHAHGDCSSEIPLAEKNEKKKAAVLAAKEDANRLFKEGNYSDAYKVYERVNQTLLVPTYLVNSALLSFLGSIDH